MHVVCGEALFDLFAAAGDKAGDNAVNLVLEPRAGGSPFNVAIGLARLRQPVAFLGGISTDFLGDRLVRVLADEGVSLDAVTRLAAPTTLALVGKDAHGAPSYCFHGAGAADRQLSLDALTRVPPGARVVHVGSFGLVVEPIATTVRALVESVRHRALVSCDPNVRLNVEPDLDRWRAALDWHAARAHVIKTSDEDLGALYPAADLETRVAAWLRQGARLVVVTRAARGATAWTPRARVDLPAQARAVVDTVGAGDTVQAALLTWLAEHGLDDPRAIESLDEAGLRAALDFALRAAAITCSRRGADLPRRAELS